MDYKRVYRCSNWKAAPPCQMKKKKKKNGTILPISYRFIEI